jgi:hypothetical protein
MAANGTERTKLPPTVRLKSFHWAFVGQYASPGKQRQLAVDETFHPTSRDEENKLNMSDKDVVILLSSYAGNQERIWGLMERLSVFNARFYTRNTIDILPRSLFEASQLDHAKVKQHFPSGSKSVIKHRNWLATSIESFV